ncbi:phosphatidic acid phosphatase type 2/haloperoxidase [Podospora didyma]|uniref:Phosphatidic acid phosphatase type 2/haloperoxidase n=1 Tax=Podospora didyma TaxID=330526 RepID=A0AAE0NG04_9PEZI|nr:phosphatidic acid phosphatase type 2/haloperoxidase [Podospora didyma]
MSPKMVLPFHRHPDSPRDVSTPSPGARRDSKGKRLGWFIVDWIKLSWKDVIAMIVLAALSLGINQAPLATVRTFSITFTTSGDIVFPQFAYPYRGWIISPTLSGLLSTLVPIGIIAIAQIRIRSFWDLNNAILGTLYSVIIGTLFQVILKQLIGGFRPYFLDICQPDISRVMGGNNNATGLNAVGFHNIMYTVDVCTNPDKQALKNAMTSFPSGHSTAAFAGYVFLFLWMNAKLKVWANYQPSFYWLALLFAPLLVAVLMACALTVDQAHNWYDILAGSTIGTVAAFAAYRVCYASIFDWRYNHIPLARREVFDYDAMGGMVPKNMERAVFVRKLGWGRRRKARRTGGGEKRISGHGMGSARSSATYAPQDTGLVSPHGQAVRYPETSRVRSSPQQHRGRLGGDDIV